MPKSGPRSIFDSLGRRPVHPFPARMAPELVSRLVERTNGKLKILDPTMGSGTVLAFALKNGHEALGIDIDPLAVLIARVWVTPVDPAKTRSTADRVLKRATQLSLDVQISDAYPVNADQETRRFVRYWFDRRARKELYALAKAIRGTRDDGIRDVLWCAFSRLIIAKQAGASLALDLAHSRPHKFYERAPALPIERFRSSVEYVLSNCIQDRVPEMMVPKAINGDARRIPAVENSIDLVITSPPYLNAIDYFRCSKFSLVWMGHTIASLRKLRSESIGTEVGRTLDNDPVMLRAIKRLKLEGLTNRKINLVQAYADDMRKALHEVYRVLKPGGSAVYVIGDNEIGGVYIKNSELLILLAKNAGLRLRRRSSRILPQSRRYLPPPRSENGKSLDARLRTEVVLQFEKTIDVKAEARRPD